MGQGNSKIETLNKTNHEIFVQIGKSQVHPNDAEWFELTDVKPLTFESGNTNWKWARLGSKFHRKFQIPN